MYIYLDSDTNEQKIIAVYLKLKLLNRKFLMKFKVTKWIRKNSIKIACNFSETTKTSTNFEKVVTRHFLKRKREILKKDFIKK